MTARTLAVAALVGALLAYCAVTGPAFTGAVLLAGAFLLAVTSPHRPLAFRIGAGVVATYVVALWAAWSSPLLLMVGFCGGVVTIGACLALLCDWADDRPESEQVAAFDAFVDRLLR